MFEGEDDDEDYDYNYPTSEWFEAHFDEVIVNMMTEFSASESDILEGLRLWYNNGEEGMDYYFGWIEDKLNEESNSESSNAESVQTGDPTNNGETNNNNPRGGKRRKSMTRKTRKTRKTRMRK